MDKMILYEDNVLLIIHKPAGIATQTSRVGQADMVSELKNYRKRKGEDTYIGVVHRLDQPVEGLLVFAKNQSMAEILSRQIQDNTLKKSYLALIQGELEENAGGKLTDFLQKDNRTNRSSVVKEGTNGAKKAVLGWNCVKTYQGKGCSVVEVELFTGRHHQIRVQFANAGMPLLGDMKYGTEASKALSKQLGITNTALLAHKLALLHPKTGKYLEYKIDWQILPIQQ
ncbi:MAG: RNA pseudouridine synthase [Lachnospiraceae bacterium]|nr:RNA pseudouridine synthase [Lachnospiraceae bacterium]